MINYVNTIFTSMACLLTFQSHHTHACIIHYVLLLCLNNEYCLFFLEPSLSLTNLTTLMENVNDRMFSQWWFIGLWLNIPQSKLNAIKNQYSSPDQCSRACWDLYITDHPSPSWKRVAHALYLGDCLEELEVVQKKYLKGEQHMN